MQVKDVTGRGWRFSRTDGTVLSKFLQLSPLGDVIIHNNPFEVGWDIQAGKLQFVNNRGEPTTSFEFEADANGRVELIGRFLLLDGQPMIHRLTGLRTYDPAIPALSSCQIRTELGRSTDTLVVTLNGRGCNAADDPRQTFYEMAGFAASVGADALMIAEREECCAWYADKAHMIVDLVDALLVRRYQAILFLGGSSGGYGSILLAELLADRHPTLDVASIAINPQTSLDEAHVDHIQRHAPARYAPAWISSAARAASNAEWTDLPALLSSPKPHTAVHKIFFDSGNPAEVYYSSLLRPFSNCRSYGERYRLSHSLGVAAIYADKGPHKIAAEMKSNRDSSRNALSGQEKVTVRPCM